MHTFTVALREPKFPGLQVTADVVRDDGKIVRTGLWPDFAEIEAGLLTEYCAKGWSRDQYWAERRVRFDAHHLATRSI